MIKYPDTLLNLINFLQLLPGVGRKTAERFAFHLLKCDQSILDSLGEIIKTLKESITHCQECGCIKNDEICLFCNKQDRLIEKICVISSPKDAYAIDETNTYKGLYHVIDHLLSPIDGFNEKQLHLDKLLKRIELFHIKEVIIALDSTLEGDATALFIKDKLSSYNIMISRLAFGIPMGSSLEFIDEGTLSHAILGRQTQF